MEEKTGLLERLNEVATALGGISDNKELRLYKVGGRLVPKKKKGSGIHIKKKNEGKFTESAKRAGQSVQEHARSVLNNPNATPLQKKRANFARNAAKWKHRKGGIFKQLNLNDLRLQFFK